MSNKQCFLLEPDNLRLHITFCEGAKTAFYKIKIDVGVIPLFTLESNVGMLVNI